VFLVARGHGRRVGEEHGRGVHDRRIDEAEEVARIIARMGKPRVDSKAGGLVSCHVVSTASAERKPTFGRNAPWRKWWPRRVYRTSAFRPARTGRMSVRPARAHGF